jgi:hypothetical protein
MTTASTELVRSPAVGPPSRAGWGGALFVWLVWAVCCAGALAFVARFGRNVPCADDWAMVPYISGRQPLTAEYLWSQHAEHRIPLPRLVTITLAWLCGGDIRSSMVFNVCALGGLAAALTLAARRARGRTAWTDAFFPIALLHFGHRWTFIWGSMAHYVVTTALAGTVLAVIVRCPKGLSPGAALATGTCLLLLPLCGAPGLALAPALALWLLYAGLRLRRGDPGQRRSGLIQLLFVGGAVLVVGAYYYDFRPAVGALMSGNVRTVLGITWRLVTTSFGTAAARAWPSSGYAMLGLLVLSADVVRRALCDPERRPWAVGVLLFVTATVLLALGVAYGRGALGYPVGFNPRYPTLTVLTPCCLYFLWGGDRRPRVARLGQAALFLLACASVLPNALDGFPEAKRHCGMLKRFEWDLRAGLPAEAFDKRYPGYFYPTVGVEGIRMMRDARIGSFRFWSENLSPFSREPGASAAAALAPGSRLNGSSSVNGPHRTPHSAGEAER